LQSSLLSKDMPQVGPLLGGSPGANDKCLLNWLCYRHNNQISVVIEPRASFVHARMRAALYGLDEGEFTESHELDRKWKVAKEMVGRRLSQEEAKRLLGKFG
jgi:hypothetical protein